MPEHNLIKALATLFFLSNSLYRQNPFIVMCSYKIKLARANKYLYKVVEIQNFIRRAPSVSLLGFK